jgi:hypothetical protein
VCACLRVRACGYPGAWACACAYVHVALLIRHATRMRHIVTSLVVPRSPLYFSTLSHKRCDFREKVIEHKMCVLIFSTNLYKTFLILEELREISSKMSKRLYVKYPLFCRILMKFEFSRQIFEKFRNIKFHPNPSSRGRVPCGQTDMKVIVAFRNFATAPKNK